MRFYRAIAFKDQKLITFMDEKRQLEKEVGDWKRKFAEMPEPSSLAPAAGAEAASAAPNNSGEQHAGKNGQVQVLQELLAKEQEALATAKKEIEALVKDVGRESDNMRILKQANEKHKSDLAAAMEDRDLWRDLYEGSAKQLDPLRN